MMIIGFTLCTVYDLLGYAPHILLSSTLGFPYLAFVVFKEYCATYKRSGMKPEKMYSFSTDQCTKFFAVACLVTGTAAMVISSIWIGMQTIPWVSRAVLGSHEVQFAADVH